MAKLDPEIAAHLEWLGFVRPKGLVVSAPALVRAGAILDRRDAEGQRLLGACVRVQASPGEDDPAPYLPEFRVFAASVLGWSFAPSAYAGTADQPVPDELEAPLPDSNETLRPDFAVRELDPKDGASPWQLLVSVLTPGADLDGDAHGRMERLLRQTGVSAGLISNGLALRLLSAPAGESSGWLDFVVADMLETAGRPITTALRLLLSETRLLSLPRAQRLAALLADSRTFQNEVSEKLAEQVLHALYELLRGFQAADDAAGGTLLREVLAAHPDQVYGALLTVNLRLVFLLFAEERDLLPNDATFLRSYSLAGLYERLREDAALFPDTMDQRYGAWAQLLVLFRMIHDGAAAGSMHLPKRHGVLFDPDRFPFLEGRVGSGARQLHERIAVPLVSDGAIHRALEKLLVLDGERISYRALDVEQIGSVYETMMGFALELATGRSVAMKAQKKQGAPTAIDLDALLAELPAKRAKAVLERADRKLTESAKRALAAAATVEDLHAALSSVIDRAATPDIVPKGAMVLQPSEERRRSGSHYTPRALTEPIVRTTLAPILERLRGPDARPPRPADLLALKICDPAMGSGAFLVEVCRQLATALVDAWKAHGERPALPPDESEEIYARRLVAQRCLYGVDRNPVAVDLAKVSLWLVTLARDHALTFVDHALRHGDSLVGLSRRQLDAFHWDPDAPRFDAGFEMMRIREHMEKVSEFRRRIREADETVTDWQLRDLWDEAQHELAQVRLFGDLAITAFFAGGTSGERESKRLAFADDLTRGKAPHHRDELEQARHAERPLAPFHWEVEFPEVFARENGGFDSIVGNPPFAGKNSVIASNVHGYSEWLKGLHEESHGNADLVAHFFRRAFHLLRRDGTFGLIATNTIRQGDTRQSGLRWIGVRGGGTIYAARRRYKWAGTAAVVVSVVWVAKGTMSGPFDLDGKSVPMITAYLFHDGGHETPAVLAANAGKSFQGSIVLGMGFTFDDGDKKGIANLLAERERLIAKDRRNGERIFPFLGGDEVNENPTHTHDRFVISFADFPLRRDALEGQSWIGADRKKREAWLRTGIVPEDYPDPVAADWPDLLDIVERRVRKDRQTDNREAYRRLWWQFAEKRGGLIRAARAMDSVLFQSFPGQYLALARLPATSVVAAPHCVFTLPQFSAFSVLQSRGHEVWALFFGSSHEERLRYLITDCFQTFPFPTGWETDAALEAAGREYYEYRAALMVRRDEGLTTTYNRFHDPEERDPDILKLRELHTAVDHAVLDAYGWTDVPTACDFFLDYEIDEEEWGNKKKPWRYRWPDDVRDDVLARLLKLNKQRAAQETQAGVAEGAVEYRPRKKARPRKAPRHGDRGQTKDLFE